MLLEVKKDLPNQCVCLWYELVLKINELELKYDNCRAVENKKL